MADQKPEADGDVPRLEGSKGGGAKALVARIAFGLCATVAILAAAAAGWWWSVGPENAKDMLAEFRHDKGEDEGIGGMRYVALPEIVANLSVGDRPSFVKVRFVIQTSSDSSEFVKSRENEIVDVLQEYVRQMTVRDLEGAAGFHRFRAGARRRVELLLGADLVSNLYVVELLSQ